jgi:hypothetical protein
MIVVPLCLTLLLLWLSRGAEFTPAGKVGLAIISAMFWACFYAGLTSNVKLL